VRLARWRRAMHLYPTHMHSSHLPADMHALHGGARVGHYRYRPVHQALALLSQRTTRLLTRLVLIRHARDRWLVRLMTIHAKAPAGHTYGSGCSLVVPPRPTACGGLRMCRSRICSSTEGVTRPLRAASRAAQGRPVLYALAGLCDWLDGAVACSERASPISDHARRR
jgi:hypothetical protein